MPGRSPWDYAVAMDIPGGRLGEAADAVYGVAVKLPAEDRVLLAEKILASLDTSEFEKLWVAEAVRRREEIRSGRAQAIPSDEVFKRVARRLGR